MRIPWNPPFVRMIAWVLVADVILTWLAANLVGPAAVKFTHAGLPGELMRAPFYILRLYIGPAILLLPQTRLRTGFHPSIGLAIGLLLTAPLAFWSTLPACPPTEPWTNLATGGLQGLILAYLAEFISRRPTSIFPRPHSTA